MSGHICLTPCPVCAGPVYAVKQRDGYRYECPACNTSSELDPDAQRSMTPEQFRAFWLSGAALDALARKVGK